MVGIGIAALMVGTGKFVKKGVNKMKGKKVEKKSKTLKKNVDQRYAEIEALNQMLSETRERERLIRELIEEEAGELADMMNGQELVMN